jgi:hypothetical protein
MTSLVLSNNLERAARNPDVAVFLGGDVVPGDAVAWQGFVDWDLFEVQVVPLISSNDANIAIPLSVFHRIDPGKAACLKFREFGIAISAFAHPQRLLDALLTMAIGLKGIDQPVPVTEVDLGGSGLHQQDASTTPSSDRATNP